MGFYLEWLLFLVSWWGLFSMRHELIGFISLDQRAREDGGLGLGSSRSSDGGRSAIGMAVAGGAGYWMTRAGARTLGRVIGAPARGVRHMRRDALERKAATSEAMREHEYEGEKALGVEAAQHVIDDESGREMNAKARKAELGARVRALEEDKQKYRERVPELEKRKRSLEGEKAKVLRQHPDYKTKADAARGQIEKADNLAKKFAGDPALETRALDVKQRLEARHAPTFAEERAIDGQLGKLDRGLTRVDAELGSMQGQAGVADRGIARWKKEMAAADKDLGLLSDERRTARSRAAHATVEGSERDFARQEFVPEAPDSGPGSAPMSRREAGASRGAAMNDGSFEMLAGRIEEKASAARRDSDYRRRRDKLDRDRRRGVR